jgi:DNA-binding NarL/FixJ family response regulator
MEASLRQGDLGQAKSTTDWLTAQAPDEPTGDATWAAALYADAVGDQDAARQALLPLILDLSRDHLLASSWYPSRLPQLVGLAMRAGAPDQAAVGVQAAAEMARRNPSEPSTAASELHARGLFNADAELLADAVALLSQTERTLAAAGAREDLAKSLIDRGNTTGAIEHLEAAYSTYSDCGAGRDSARVRAALRSLGVRKRKMTTATALGDWEGLTKSERLVVDLVAKGLTNREAATELFLSPYTINVHLRHAFVKLGIRSRVQLARRVAERGQGQQRAGAPGVPTVN